MTVESAAFDRYRRPPNEKTTLLRLAAGSIIVVVCWFGLTAIVLAIGGYLQSSFGSLLGAEPITFADENFLEGFMASRMGFVASLLSFGGIWIGVWIAMRALHKEPLANLFGNSGRISRSGFARGLAAVLLTSIVAEAATYLISQGIARGPIEFSAWLLFLVPVLLLAFLQTSSEEILFRGYLLRGLASRFASPWVWALPPTVLFTALHWNSAAALSMNIGVFLSIGVFAALLVLLVWQTGNLGAAMGAHLGNNLAGFLLVSHDDALASFALFRGPPLDVLTGTAMQTVFLIGISLAAVVAAFLLLLHPASPLKVDVDLGRHP